MTYHFDFKLGKLVPIADGGLLPVGSVVTYEDRANPRKQFVVVGAALDGHGQRCICEDGHVAHVSKSACDGLGGWEIVLQRDKTPLIHNAEEIQRFVFASEERGRQLQVEREAREKKKAEEREQLRTRYLTEFAWLELATASTKSGHALGAANLRRELKRQFPGHKFSVRSDCFSGGDSIDISWTLGPTNEEVKRITNKYSEGSFNGMDDIYEYDHSLWPTMFGGAKYVHTHRGLGEAANVVAAALCDLWNLPKPADGKSYWKVQADERSNKDIGAIANEILRAGSYPAGAVITGIERLDGVTCGQWPDFYRAKVA
jgi:hypothetical protein